MMNWIPSKDKVVGDKNQIQRYIKDDGYKMPIFGSYSYDPINQAFEVNDKPIQVTTASANKNIENTVIHLLEIRTKTTTSAPDSEEATKGITDQNDPAANNGEEETSPFIMYPPSSSVVPPGRMRAMNTQKPYKKMQLVSARNPHPLRSKSEIGLRGLEVFSEKVNLSMTKH